MQIVSRSEFLELPAGTVFAEWEPCVVGELCIKDETLKPADGYVGDFFYHPLGPWLSPDNSQLELNKDTQRDGVFDESQQYLVFDQDDVQILVGKLQGSFVAGNETVCPVELS